MVNQAEQPENTGAPAVDSGNTTTDITSEFNGVDTFDDTSTAPTDIDTTDSTEQSSVPGGVPAESPGGTEALPPSDAPTMPPDTGLPSLQPQEDIQRRMSALEQQNMQYQVGEQERQLMAQRDKYATDLENAGYLPDQAAYVANNWYSSANEQVSRQNEQVQYAEYIRGQQAAAEHFANKYKLELPDLRELRQYQTPESMETAAKRLASDREKDAEIAKLRAQMVPSQSFEDNQSTPAASNSEERWLERYNQGDRSPEAQSAARRAAGLG